MSSNADAKQVTVWAWYPEFEQVVDLFNNTHDDVQVCWTNAGQGNDEYTKFSTTIEAGSGAADVIQLENEVISSFSIRKALADISEYGAADVKDDYTAQRVRVLYTGGTIGMQASANGLAPASGFEARMREQLASQPQLQIGRAHV